MGKLTGKVALITGGSEGMGFSTAQEFIKEGAFVFITGRRKPQLEKAIAELGENSFGIQADAGKLQDLDRMYAEIKEKKGKIDVVFANAGIYEQMPYDKVTEDFYDKCVDINVKGVFFTIQKAIPLMDKNASIILNGSFIGSSGFPGMSVYGATKAAVRSFARTFTAELKGVGPRINLISPGPVDTAGNASTLGSNKEIREYVTKMVPRGRIGRGDDIGKVAVFLASDDSSFVAGVELFVDGGVNAV
jgi:NAD(P)-dependent dehydrogenase (short-subunit alcohol dehydrogenase family)